MSRDISMQRFKMAGAKPGHILILLLLIEGLLYEINIIQKPILPLKYFLETFSNA